MTKQYWKHQIKQLKYSVNHCQPQNVRDYENAIDYAERKLKELK